MRLKYIITVGDKFGKCEIVSQEPSVDGRRYVKIKCECGTEKRIRFEALVRGTTTSCGCVNKTRSRKTHGLIDIPEYAIWKAMKTRCMCRTNSAYPNYGGRGIVICERWLEHRRGFQNFLADIGRRPTNRHSIDRINNDGNYEPANCRWATAAQQGRNTRRTRWLNVNGEQICLTDLASNLGISVKALASRLDRHPSVEHAVQEENPYGVGGPRWPTKRS